MTATSISDLCVGDISASAAECVLCYQTVGNSCRVLPDRREQFQGSRKILTSFTYAVCQSWLHKRALWTEASVTNLISVIKDEGGNVCEA
jgi:hypothetical protein